MPVISTSFDLTNVEWRHVHDTSDPAFYIDFDYSLLGYDLPSGRLDMLLRYGKGGHCRRHRHLASTVTLVLEGEQFLTEMLPDGTTKKIHRKKGDYALAAADALPHDEHGGPEGGTIMLSMTAVDGLLFEYFDENMANGWALSIEEYVDNWNKGVIHASAPPQALSTHR